MNNKAVFLDKDGTLIENVPYNVEVDKIRFTEGALEGVQQLYQAGFQIFIVTNQAGVAHGRFTEEDLKPVEAYIRSEMEAVGVPLAGFYYCPHHPEAKVAGYGQRCFCRKPSPGLLFQASREHNINLASSWVVGDILNDIEAGRRVDCRSVLLDIGNETEWKFSALRRPHYTVKTFGQAVQAILEAEQWVAPPAAVATARRAAAQPSAAALAARVAARLAARS